MDFSSPIIPGGSSESFSASQALSKAMERRLTRPSRTATPSTKMMSHALAGRCSPDVPSLPSVKKPQCTNDKAGRRSVLPPGAESRSGQPKRPSSVIAMTGMQAMQRQEDLLEVEPGKWSRSTSSTSDGTRLSEASRSSMTQDFGARTSAKTPTTSFNSRQSEKRPTTPSATGMVSSATQKRRASLGAVQNPTSPSSSTGPTDSMCPTSPMSPTRTPKRPGTEQSRRRSDQLKADLLLPSSGAGGIRRRTSAGASTEQRHHQEPDASEQAKDKKDSENTRHANMMEVVKMAKQHNLPMKDMWERWSAFQALALDPAGNLPVVEFFKLVRKECGVRDGFDVPQNMLPKQKEFQQRGCVSFLEYFDWVREKSFTEEMAVQGQERSIRRIATDLGLTVLDVEKISDIFKKFDVDGSGVLELDEFKDMFCKVKNISSDDMPDATLMRYFRQIDTDGNGTVDLKEFTFWYYNCFMKEGKASVGGVTQERSWTPRRNTGGVKTKA
eukprot:TRINITY_DN46974_c0_g1_i1.p1 TRINITY_DN46974_c0_g1~~TRINITY_DN46974_c0_g1_i1.p1  ORF type:complete len:499 (+),score=68.08 TRINITY_DN46974_c0_g1_i1:67-1563(+)